MYSWSEMIDKIISIQIGLAGIQNTRITQNHTKIRE